MRTQEENAAEPRSKPSLKKKTLKDLELDDSAKCQARGGASSTAYGRRLSLAPSTSSGTVSLSSKG